MSTDTKELYPYLHLASNEFYEMEPCRAARDWLREQGYYDGISNPLNLEQAWLKLKHRPDWMLWLLNNVYNTKTVKRITRHQMEYMALVAAQRFLGHFTAIAKDFKYVDVVQWSDKEQRYMDVSPPPQARNVLNEIDHCIGMMACSGISGVGGSTLSPTVEQWEEKIGFFSCVTNATCLENSSGAELSTQQCKLHTNGQRAIRILRYALRVHKKYAANPDSYPQTMLIEIMDQFTTSGYITGDIDWMNREAGTPTYEESKSNNWWCDMIRSIMTPELLGKNITLSKKVY